MKQSLNNAPEEGVLAIGKIRRAHGIRGALVVFIYSGSIDVLRSLRHVYIEGREFELKKVSPKKGKEAIISLKSINDRNTAETFRGKELFCLISDLPQTEEDEFYWFEIAGYSIYDKDGKVIGKVRSLLETKGHDLIAGEGSSGEFFIPIVNQFILEIRHDEKKIIVDIPEGLIETQ